MLPLPFVGVSDRTFPVYGKKLSAARQAASLSQAALGEIIGRSPSGVYKMESQYIARLFHRVRSKLATALKLSEGEFTRTVAVPPHRIAATRPSGPTADLLRALTLLIGKLERGTPVNDRQWTKVTDLIAAVRELDPPRKYQRLVGDDVNPPGRRAGSDGLSARGARKPEQRHKRRPRDGQVQG